ncbi:MAG: GNAT family N-acetyltransferase [Herpetosiphon sp.]
MLQAAVNESLEHLLPWMPWAHSEPETIQQKVDRLRQFRGEFDLGQDFVYGVFNRDESRVLGGSGLHMRAGENAREVGYWIHQAFINQGLATEVSAALTQVAFRVDLVRRVEIRCDARNLRSAAVPRKLGFTHTATEARPGARFQPAGETMVWQLTADDYAGNRAAALEIETFDAAGRRIG